MIFGAFGEHYYVHPGLSARRLGRAQEPRGSPRPNRPTAGFRLPNGEFYVPDATFEIRAKTSRPPELQEKMRAHIANGVQLAVLIDPYILAR